MKCFVDTGAFAALYNMKDDHRAEALAVWASLRAQNALLYTIRDVVVETAALLRRRAGHKVAVDCGNDLWADDALVRVLHPEDHHDREAWKVFRRYSDKELSFVDCLSFVFMKELRLTHAFTFDKNFAQLGFEPLRP